MAMPELSQGTSTESSVISARVAYALGSQLYECTYTVLESIHESNSYQISRTN